MDTPPPLPSEHVYFDPPDAPRDDTWWVRYVSSFTGMSDTALLALEADCRYIAERGILDAARADLWPPGRVRTGLVMGSVQSLSLIHI